MGYNVFSDELSTLIVDPNKKQIINTLNPHSYVTAKNDKAFGEALRESSTLIADGSGIVIAAKQINGVTINKIAGADLHKYLLHLLNERGGSVFYMGSAKNTLNKIYERISKEYPDIRVGICSPPYKPEFTDEENEAIINKINQFNPDVLFVGMTAPKQEKWLHAHKDSLNFQIASCVGAVFDFYAGTVQRSSQFWIDLHLEWLPRLLKEPKRLWKRNFVSAPLFLVDMVLHKIGMMK
jgi:N-acetylglucosaminyldiphosphoundecaprenol N-acetyl-beta-D-mannosaminyltransferase